MAESENLQDLSSKPTQFETRVKDELETLNLRISSINQLGKETGKAERMFDDTLEESFQMLKNCAIQVGTRVIERVRPYFKMVKHVRMARKNVQLHATACDRAEEHCCAMKNKLKEVEERVVETIGGHQVDIEGLEMLNKVIKDVMEAGDLKCKYAMKLHECNLNLTLKRKKLAKLQKTLGHDIEKARPYYDLKSELNRKLRHQKEKVESCQNDFRYAKKDYNEAMQNVEKISEEIHIERERLKDTPN